MLITVVMVAFVLVDGASPSRRPSLWRCGRDHSATVTLARLIDRAGGGRRGAGASSPPPPPRRRPRACMTPRDVVRWPAPKGATRGVSSDVDPDARRVAVVGSRQIELAHRRTADRRVPHALGAGALTAVTSLFVAMGGGGFRPGIYCYRTSPNHEIEDSETDATILSFIVQCV